MKNLLYIIAGLLLILWGVMVYGFKSPPRIIHLLIPVAGIIILLRIFFNKKTSKRIK